MLVLRKERWGMGRALARAETVSSLREDERPQRMRLPSLPCLKFGEVPPRTLPEGGSATFPFCEGTFSGGMLGAVPARAEHVFDITYRLSTTTPL